jgi:hypothetical protein
MHSAARGQSKGEAGMNVRGNYWNYSIGCFAVWGILLAVVAAKGNGHTTDKILLIFGGWSIAWVSTTIARFVYPPPKRWLETNAASS